MQVFQQKTPLPGTTQAGEHTVCSVGGRGRGGGTPAVCTAAGATAAAVMPAAMGLVGTLAGFFSLFRGRAWLALGGGVGRSGLGGLVFAGDAGLAAPASAAPAAAGVFLFRRLTGWEKGGLALRSGIGLGAGLAAVAGLLLFLLALPIGFQLALGLPGVAALVAAQTAAGLAALAFAAAGLVLF